MIELEAEASQICGELDPHGTYPPVMGAGCKKHPRLALVFVNPTVRNLSVHPDWDGPRMPFVGNSALFRTLSRASVLPPDFADLTVSRSEWTPELADMVYRVVVQAGVYITNVVKLTCRDSRYPARASVEAFTPVLIRELSAIEPRLIVAMGLLPFATLTGRTIRLQDVLTEVRGGRGVRIYESIVGRPVAPCYFPVGRGRPALSCEVLSRIVKQLA